MREHVKSQLSHGHFKFHGMIQNMQKLLKVEALCPETCKLSLECRDPVETTTRAETHVDEADHTPGTTRAETHAVEKPHSPGNHPCRD